MKWLAGLQGGEAEIKIMGSIDTLRLNGRYRLYERRILFARIESLF